MQYKYHNALSSIITTASNATIDDTNTLQSTKSAWKRRTSVPIVIDFNNDLEQFPPLTPISTTKAPPPPRTINTNTSQAVNNAVTEALAAAKEEHRSEMEALRSELRDLKVTFQMLAQTIANQSETIMHHLQLNNATAATKPTTENDEPSPPRKRRDKGNNKKTPTRHNMSSKTNATTRQENTGATNATTAINRRLEWYGNNNNNDENMSDTTDNSHSTNDEPSRQIAAITARAPDSINGDKERPEEEIIFEIEDRPQNIDPAPTKNAVLLLAKAPAAISTIVMETSATDNDETFYSYTNPSTEDDFFEMMSTHSNDAAGKNNVPSTQEDTKMSSGRED
jgi:hypothetical protein